MRGSLFNIIIAGLLLSSVVLSAIPPAVDKATVQSELKWEPASKIATVNTVDNSTFIDANKILMFVTNHGNFGRDLIDVFGYDEGTFFPFLDTSFIRDSSLNASPLYAAGLWLGGIDSASGQTRLAISEYSCEYVPGPMNRGRRSIFSEIR